MWVLLLCPSFTHLGSATVVWRPWINHKNDLIAAKYPDILMPKQTCYCSIFEGRAIKVSKPTVEAVKTRNIDIYNFCVTSSYNQHLNR